MRLEQVQSRCSGWRPLGPAGSRRSAAADEFAAACQSECRPGGPYGALWNSDQSECAAGGRYGALETVLARGGDGGLDRELGELLDTLSGRLGSDRVTRVEPAETHIPERAFLHRPVGETARCQVSLARVTGADRPSLLLARPEPIEAMALTPDGPPSWLRWRGCEHTIMASFGPERVGCEWWKGRSDEATPRRSDEGRTRDYFKVQDERGRWLWVYRTRGSPGATSRWFVHGEWG